VLTDAPVVKLLTDCPAIVIVNTHKHLGDGFDTDPRLHFDLQAIAEHFFLGVER
jgi:hypothetical protein